MDYSNSYSNFKLEYSNSNSNIHIFTTFRWKLSLHILWNSISCDVIFAEPEGIKITSRKFDVTLTSFTVKAPFPASSLVDPLEKKEDLHSWTITYFLYLEMMLQDSFFFILLHFFWQIGQFSIFRNEIYKPWGFQQCIAWSTKVAKNMSTCCLFHKNSQFWINNGIFWPILCNFNWFIFKIGFCGGKPKP